MKKLEPSTPLAGQVALVTGANSGIGRAVAVCLAEAGAKVVVNYVVGDDDARAVVDHIESMGGAAIALQADVSDEAQVDALFAKAIEVYDTVDIAVSNAGIQRDAPFIEMSLAQWQKVIDVNLTGGFLCARAAAREYIRRGVRADISQSAGKIVFISSVHEVIPWAQHSNYAASKGGVMLLMKSIAQELAGHSIRVNSVAPGAIKTPINTAAWNSPEAEKNLLKLIPSHRVGNPEDIGRAVVWLASDDSEYVNGTTLFVDGGMTLYPGFATGG